MQLCINFFGTLAISLIVFYGIQLQGEFIVFWIAYYTATCVGIILVGGVLQQITVAVQRYRSSGMPIDVPMHDVSMHNVPIHKVPMHSV